MKKSLKLSILSVAACAVICSSVLLALDPKDGHGKPEPPMAGTHWARGNAPHTTAGRGGRSPNMSWHNGPNMKTAEVTAIFWGSSWSETSDKVTGMDSFYSGITGSPYATTSNEYYDSQGYPTSVINYNGHLIDNSAATGGSNTGPILTEVCKMISNPVSNGYYPVYVDLLRGNAGFCAWHSYSTCGGVTVQFAFFFDLDGDAGCDPQDYSTGHSQGLAAIANVSGHEISEARSDPHLNAWYDNSGDENADKCAWSFGSNSVPFSNNTSWKIQGNWSNSAYNTTSRGYPNRNGQKGCIDGGNYN
jgi:hypothetical protein